MYVCDDKGETLDMSWDDKVDQNLYLRRSMGSQGPLRESLALVGMGFHAKGYDQEAAWPKPPLYNGEPDYDDPDFVAAVAFRLKHSYDERPGIPLHKLCMNEGWWVTQVECESALALWKRAGRPMLSEFRDDLIPFLRQAAANGGFRVF